MRYLLLGGQDDTLGVLANMGIARPSRGQLYFTLASMVAVLNAVVGGSAVAFVAGVVGATPGPAAGIGAVTGVVSRALQFRWQRRGHADARHRGEVLFPSPTSAERRGRFSRVTHSRPAERLTKGFFAPRAESAD